MPENVWTEEMVEQQRQRVAKTRQEPTRAVREGLQAAIASQPTPSKHRNRKCIVGGIAFDSEKEARRYQELRLLEQVGAIRDLRLQVSFDLWACNGERVARYVADFVYWSLEYGKTVVEDVKSPHTRKLPVYRLKCKLMAAQGTPITEV